MFYSLKTNNLQYFKQIIYFIINSKPWLFSFDSLAKNLKIWWDTLKNYIRILEEIWLLRIMEFDWNITQKIRKSKKIYFMINNINYLNSYSSFNNIWRMRETFFISNIINYSNFYDNSVKIFYSEKWDFSINKHNKKYIFEIWWISKTKKQISWLENSFIVKDNIRDFWEWIIPLWVFWFLY